jgi:hypothetical protein
MKNILAYFDAILTFKKSLMVLTLGKLFAENKALSANVIKLSHSSVSTKLQYCSFSSYLILFTRLERLERYKHSSLLG